MIVSYSIIVYYETTQIGDIMKKFILFSILSALLYSAPGHAGGWWSSRTAVTEPTAAEAALAAEELAEEKLAEEARREAFNIITWEDNLAAKSAEELAAAREKAAETSPEHVQLKEVMATQVEECRAANAQVEEFKAKVAQAYGVPLCDEVEIATQRRGAANDRVEKFNALVAQAYEEWMPLVGPRRSNVIACSNGGRER